MTTTDFLPIAAATVRDIAQAKGAEHRIRTHGRAEALVGLLSHITRLADLWLDHMERRQNYRKLMALDERMLADMGLDRDTLWSDLQQPRRTSVPPHHL